MSQKNETPILILSLLITTGLIAGGWWWFNKNNSFNVNSLTKPQESEAAPQIPTSETSGKNFSSVENVPTGLFNYGGSTSWAPVRQSIHKKIQAARPVFRLRYVQRLSCSTYVLVSKC